MGTLGSPPSLNQWGVRPPQRVAACGLKGAVQSPFTQMQSPASHRWTQALEWKVQNRGPAERESQLVCLNWQLLPLLRLLGTHGPWMEALVVIAPHFCTLVSVTGALPRFHTWIPNATLLRVDSNLPSRSWGSFPWSQP
jgi:hypothetical protein